MLESQALSGLVTGTVISTAKDKAEVIDKNQEKMFKNIIGGLGGWGGWVDWCHFRLVLTAGISPWH